MIWFILPLFGTWFWILSIATLIIFISCVESEAPAGAFCTLLVWFVVFVLFGEAWKALTWIAEHPLQVGGTVLVYIIAGFFWGVIHWWWRQNKRRREYDDKRFTFLSNKGLLNGNSTSHKSVKIPSTLLEEWRKFLGLSWRIQSYNEHFTENKKRIVNRMIYWPVSLGSYFFKDFLVELYMTVVHKTQAIFVGIEKRAWAGTEDDFRGANSEG